MNSQLLPSFFAGLFHTAPSGLFTGALLFLCLLGAFGCQGVEHHQKGRFANSIMIFDPDGSETHFHQKTYYSREGSAGGIGSSAGGGCGCY